MASSEQYDQHCTEDELALLALGEPATDPTRAAHLAACMSCRSALDQLRSVVATARAVTPEDVPVAPPPTLWEGVAQAVRAEPAVPAGLPGLAVVPAPGATTVPGSPPAGVRLHARRRPQWRVRAAAVTAVAAVVVGGAVVVLHPFGSGTRATGAVADITLSPVGDSTARGVAVMSAGKDGATMHVNVPGLPHRDGFYEVWLMRSPTALISLGVLDDHDQGTFAVPAGVDVARYPYVNVSLEPFDGNPAHSGDSVARGRLPA